MALNFSDEERVYSVLLVSSSEKFNQSMCELLEKAKYSPVKTITDVSCARRELVERKYDLILINSPVLGEVGTRFAISAADGGAGVMIFVRSELYDEICSKVSTFGVLTLSKPTSAQMVMQSLKLLCATRERLKMLETKNATLEEKMEEIRIVNRAKWVLISELKLTEADAHRFIEKQAMDRCTSKREIAAEIIKTYS